MKRLSCPFCSHRDRRVAMLVFSLMAIDALASAQPILPVGFVDESIAGGFNQPTAFTVLPDGRLLVAEKPGLVRVIKNGAILSAPFIDVRSSVNDYWDHGLLGIAADRNFATNGFVYLLFTYENDPLDYSGPKTGRLIRVTATGDSAAASTAATILGTSVGSTCKNFPAGADCLPSDNPSHSVGNVRVAADGTLWVTHGDGASFNLVDDDALRAQNLDSLAGKLLHITPAGQGLSSNPFWNGNANANRSKVWAYGVRNPYRFALHPTSGMPYLGDVGWNAWEEVDIPLSSAISFNLGWPCYEGNLHQSGYAAKALCQSLYTTEPTGVLAPAIAYSHNSGSSAVTGGVFYNGTSFPSQYQGAFFYADYAVGFIRYFAVGTDGSMSGPLTGFAANVAGPVHMDTDGDSLLYVAINTGEVRRIRYITPASGVTYLSDQNWTSASNGLGPIERDQSNGNAGAMDGRVIRLRGQSYAKGLGAAAPSNVTFALGGACSAFNASVGVDDEVGSSGSVVFQVWVDGVKRYDSLTMTNSTATKAINLAISGASELRLVVTDAGNGNVNDHADWADARVTCATAADTTPPSVSGVVPANGATGVSPVSTVVASFSEVLTASTVTSSTFTLMPQGTTTPVAATVSYNAATAKATLTPATTLSGTATYVATVKGGAGGVTDAAGNALPSDVTWTFTTAVTGTPMYVSDLPFAAQDNGHGPVERDMSNGEQLAGDGRTITLNGATFPKGLGVHAPSEVRVVLNGACSVFSAVIGVDDEVGSNGNVVFQVWGDSVLRYDSGPMTGAQAGRSIAVDITGANTLVLLVRDGGDTNAYDHADWANAQITCATTTNTPPTATITQPLSGLQYSVGDVINYSGSGSDAEDGSLAPSRLFWNIVIHHCPGGVCHTHPFTSSTGANGTFTVPDHGDESYFEVVLTATDSAGAPASTSVSIQPRTVQLLLNTSPTGLQVVYGGTSATAPVTYTTIVGSAHTIFAPSPQGSAVFSAWSDGGAQQHTITIGSTNVTYTATFTTSQGDTTPPTVTSMTPAGGATGVSGTTAVSAVFSEAMTASTITQATFTLVPQGSTTPVSATVTYTSTSLTATLTPAASLAAGTSYTATVKGGTSGVKDVAGNAMAADRVWSFTVASSSPTTISVSDSPFISATNGYGPVERDMSNGEQLAGDGRTITLNGVTFAKGVGVHSPSDVRIAISGCSTFTAVVGVDDEVGANGSVVFQVLADGVQRFTSGTLTGPMGGQSINVDVTGAAQLAFIVANAGDSSDYDHADWANPTLSCGGGADTTAPTVTTVTPAAGATSVAATTNVTATFSEAMSAASLTTTTFTLVPQGSTTPVAATVTYTGASLTATLTPAVALAASTTYTATVKGGTNGARDLAGNALAVDRVWSFTVAAPTDTTAPTVTSVTPAAGATSVSAGTNVSATFSEAMSAASLTTATFTLVPQGSTTPVSATVTYASAPLTATLTPAAALAAGATYTATVKGGTNGVKDLAGNALAVDRVWSFTVAAAQGSTTSISDLPFTFATNGYGPVERDMTNGENLAGDGRTITLNGVTYAKGLGAHAPSEVRLAVNSCSTFTAVVGVDDEVGANGSVAFQVWTDGVQRFNTGTLTGAAAGQSISVDISGATQLALIVTDGGNNPDYDHADWAGAAISCGPPPPDTTAPTVTAVTPAANATSVAITATVRATFSEAMNAGSLTATSVTLVPQGSTVPVPATVSYDAGSRIVTLSPSANLTTSTTYTATVKGGAGGATDLAGNPLATDRVWSFTTAAPDTTAPTITTTSPANGATNVSRGANITATFSEPVTASTVTTATVFLVRQGTTSPLAATVTYDAAANRVTLDPSASLAAVTSYTATVRGGTSGVKDLGGNALAVDRVWTFTTR